MDFHDLRTIYILPWATGDGENMLQRKEIEDNGGGSDDDDVDDDDDDDDAIIIGVDRPLHPSPT